MKVKKKMQTNDEIPKDCIKRQSDIVYQKFA